MIAVVTGIEHFLNLVPAHVSCDVCKGVFKANMAKYPPPAERHALIAALEDAGWLVRGEHEAHVCPDCNPLPEETFTRD